MKKYITTALWFLFGYFFIILPTRAFYTNWTYFPEALVPFCTTYIISVKKRDTIRSLYVMLTGLAVILILEFPMRIADFNGSALTVVGFFLFIAGCILGCIFALKRNVLTICLITLFFAFAAFYSCKGHSMWVHYLNYGTFSGRIQAHPVKDYQFYDENGNTISMSDLRGKEVVIYCWTKYCGICRQKMPILQELHDKFKNNNNICIVSLFVAVEGKDNLQDGNSITKDMGHNLSVWSIYDNHDFLKDYGIDRYPNTFIINAEGNVIYHGNLDGIINYLQR